jgi:PilZ domain-containing protein
MKVAASDRRQTVRHNFRTPIRVHWWKSAFPDQESESENLSENGILFMTNSEMRVGTILEILLKMPELITNEPAAEWLCSGHVVRVEAIASAMGKFGVSMQFDCYQIARENGASAIGSCLPRQAPDAGSGESRNEESRALCLRAIQSLTCKTNE